MKSEMSGVGEKWIGYICEVLYPLLAPGPILCSLMHGESIHDQLNYYLGFHKYAIYPSASFYVASKWIFSDESPKIHL